MHSMSNLEVDGLQLQNITPVFTVFTPVSYECESEATVSTGFQILDS